LFFSNKVVQNLYTENRISEQTRNIGLIDHWSLASDYTLHLTPYILYPHTAAAWRHQRDFLTSSSGALGWLVGLVTSGLRELARFIVAR
jgi:hypothetical protein